MKSGALSKMPRAEQWADQICVQLGKSVESILNTGRLLLKAKADLPHGEWGRMFEDELVPFSQNVAGQFMRVATNPVLSNSAYVQSLPPSWGTLYELTKVPEPTLKNALKDGVITFEMKRSDVRALLPPSESKPRPEPRALALPSESVQSVLDAIQEQLDGLWAKHPREHATIQAAISSWETYFAIKRGAE